MGEGDLDADAVEGALGLFDHPVLHPEDVGEGVVPDVGGELHRAVAEFGDQHAGGGVVEDLVDCGQAGLDGGDRVGGVVAIVDADGDGEAVAAASRPVDDGVLEDLGGRQDDAVTAEGVDDDRARVDLLDHAEELLVADLDPRAPAEGALGLEDHAGDEVLEDVLEREGEGDAADAERADEQADLDADRAERIDEPEHDDQRGGETAEETGRAVRQAGHRPVEDQADDDGDDDRPHEDEARLEPIRRGQAVGDGFLELVGVGADLGEEAGE